MPNINAPSKHSLTMLLLSFFFFFFLVPKVIANKYFNIDLDFARVRMEGGQFIKIPGRCLDEMLSEIWLEPPS